MNKFDKKIKELAKTEHREVPKSVVKVIDDTLEGLPESSNNVHRINYVSKIVGIAACFVLVMFVVVPNVSPAYAEALESVPVVGKLVKLVTIRNYYYSDGNYEMDIKVPEVQNQNEAGEFINKDVNQL
ncbi:anti-SigV factor, partial [gut metagenome]